MTQFFVRGASAVVSEPPWVAIGEGHLLSEPSAPCSFCGTGSGTVSWMGATVGRAVRICEQCVWLAADILSEEILAESYPLAPRAPAFAPERPPSLVDLEHQLEAVAETFPGWSIEDEIERAGRMVEEEPPGSARTFPSQFVCGFCERHQSEVAKLIAGKSAYVCDVCAMTLARVLPEEACPRPDSREIRGANLNVSLRDRLVRATSELEQDPSDARLWRLASELYERTGDVEAAGQAFLRAAKLALDDDMLLVALHLITSALRVDPQSSEAEECVADIETRLGFGTSRG